MLDSLDTTALRLALRRLVATRGPVSLIRSDRGTNFAAAAADAASLDVGPSPSGLGCTWDLNPAIAPHAGGVWERPVGLVKQALSGCLASTAGRFLSLAEFHTLLLEAAAIVNRTPLWAVQAAPDDPTPLCPDHLLTLKPSPAAAARDLRPDDILATGPKRWRRVQLLAEQFWTKWRLGYLTDLHQRNKWLRPRRNAEVGDVVLLRDAALQRSDWPFAIVVEVHPGTDGLVRRVSLRVPGRRGSAGGAGLFLRHVSQVVLLQPARRAGSADESDDSDDGAATEDEATDDRQTAIDAAATARASTGSADESDDSEGEAATEDVATDDRQTAIDAAATSGAASDGTVPANVVSGDRQTAFDAAATARADARASATPAARPPAAVAPRPTRTKRRPDRLDL